MSKNLNMSKKRGPNSPNESEKQKPRPGKNKKLTKRDKLEARTKLKSSTGGKKLSEKRRTDGFACEVGKRSRKKKKLN